MKRRNKKNNVRPPRALLIALGCAKNMIDAEQTLAELAAGGFELTTAAADADLILINTCGFIQPARDEAETEIAAALAAKADNPELKVVAMGCYAQRAGNALRRQFPELDGVFGLNINGRLAQYCLSVLGGKTVSGGFSRRPQVPEGPRLVSTPESYAYLRIADGCSNRCAYCAIPAIRGGLRSRPADAVIAEAQALYEQGRPELIVIAQDITCYGLDRHEPDALQMLVERLLAETAFPRIRLLYAHPAHLRPGILQLIGNEPRLCNYLDLPLQHVNTRILQAMNRHYGREKIDEIYGWIDKYCPRLVLRSSAIVGFPGETDSEFAELLDFAASGKLSRLGAFIYSPEADTAAALLPGQIPAAVAEERFASLMQAQQTAAFRQLDARVGQVEKILIDGFRDVDADSDDGNSVAVVGRSVAEAPEADGEILLAGLTPAQAAEICPGEFYQVKIVRRQGYDLAAERV